MSKCQSVNRGFTAGAFFLLTACVSFDALQPADTASYVLTPPAIEAAAVASNAAHLVVEYPSANPGVASDRIVLEREANRMEYVSGARWATDLPSLVQSTMVESFGRSALFASVSPNVRYQGPTLVLRVNIQAFQADYTGSTAAPQAIVRFSFQLMDMDRRIIVRSGDAQAVETAMTNRLRDIIRAFDSAYASAFGTVLLEITKSTQPDL